MQNTVADKRFVQISAHTHTRLIALCLGLSGWASTRKVKPIWILLKQETVSGSGISWAIPVCKSAHCSSQITMPVPHRSVFYRLDTLPAAQPTVSEHWKQFVQISVPRGKITNVHCSPQFARRATVCWQCCASEAEQCQKSGQEKARTHWTSQAAITLPFLSQLALYKNKTLCIFTHVIIIHASLFLLSSINLLL